MLLNIEAMYMGEKFIRVNISGLILAMVKRISDSQLNI